MIQQRVINSWSCLVTGDFFGRPENLDFIKRAGCKLIFSGVESFRKSTLQTYNKRQNTIVPQVEMIRNCLEKGVAFAYGIMLDPITRDISDLRSEIEFILGTPEITLPAFFTLTIPLIGTPYFNDCVKQRLFFPETKLRFLDGITLTMRPRDPIEQVLAFIRTVPNLRGYREQGTGSLAEVHAQIRPDLGCDTAERCTRQRTVDQHRVIRVVTDTLRLEASAQDFLRAHRALGRLLYADDPCVRTVPRPLPADDGDRRNRGTA